MENRNPVRTVVLANLEEYVSPLFDGFPGRETQKWEAQCRAESDMALFWEGDDKLVVTTDPPPSELVDAACHCLGYGNVAAVSPRRRSHSLCDDIRADRRAFDRLVQAIDSSPAPRLAVWAATPQLYALVDELLACGIGDLAVEAPDRSAYWTVPYLGSKSGFRDFVANQRREPPCTMAVPKGVVYSNPDIAAHAFASRWATSNGAVAKADRGVAGLGLLMLRKDRIRETVDPGAFFRAWARTQPLLQAGPVVVEELVDGSEYGKRPPSCSIQLFADAGGHVHVKAVALQSLTETGGYEGASFGRSFLEGDLAARLRELGRQIGSAASALGYRGHFGVDTVAGVRNQLVCTDFNARRTSVCSALEIASRVFGEKFEETGAVASSAHVRVGKHPGCMAPSQAVRLLEPILLQPGADSGIVPSILGSLEHCVREPTIGFVAVGPDAGNAVALNKEARDRLARGQ
jgi:hypothetical protein